MPELLSDLTASPLLPVGGYQQPQEAAWAKHMPRYSRAVAAGNVNLAERIEEDVAVEAERLIRRSQGTMQPQPTPADPRLGEIERELRAMATDGYFNPQASDPGHRMTPEGLEIDIGRGPLVTDNQNAPPAMVDEGRPLARMGQLPIMPALPIAATPPPQPDEDEVLEMVRRVGREQRMREAGFDPNETLGGSLQRFGVEAAPMAAAAVAGPVIGGAAKLVAPPLARAASTFAAAYPRTAGGLEGLTAGGAYTGAQKASEILTAQAQEQTPAGLPTDITERQGVLAREGYYGGKIDGNRGNETKEAEKKWLADAPQRAAAAERRRQQANEADARQQQLELLRGQQTIDAAKGKAAESEAEAKRIEAEAKKAEADRQAALDAEARKRTAEKPAWRQAIEDYGPLAGSAIGLYLGGATRVGSVKKYDAAAKERAARADALAAQMRPNTAVTAKTLEPRYGRINTIYTEGQNPWFPRTSPYQPAPGFNPAVRANRDAPGATKLYEARQPQNFLKDASLVGLGLGDYVVANERAQTYRGLAKDAEAASARPGGDTQANRDRVDRYNLLADLAETAKAAGPAFSVGYLGSALKYGRTTPRPAKIDKVDAERAQIDKYLAGPKAPAPSPGGGPAKVAGGNGLAPPALQVAAARARKNFIDLAEKKPAEFNKVFDDLKADAANFTKEGVLRPTAVNKAYQQLNALLPAGEKVHRVSLRSHLKQLKEFKLP